MFFTRQPPVEVPETTCPQRRQLLRVLAGGAALAVIPGAASAASKVGGKARKLDFVHLHTGERLSVTYRIGDRYVPEGLAGLSRLMRDFRSGDVHPMDPALFDILWDLRQNLRTSAPFEIVSAYRSPRTNAMLRGKSANTGVAKKSMHLTGQAIDIRVPGVPLSRVRDAAVELKRGGVGYYASSNFVHIDTGRVRRW